VLVDFYLPDLHKGAITREQARELIAHLMLAMNIPYPRGHILPLMLGGMGADNQDASNELTEVCLEVCEDLGLLHPSLALRYHRKIPRPLLKQAVRMWAKGNGYPALFNDDVVVPALINSGVKPADAYEYIHSVCTEITAVGKTNAWISNPYFNVAKPLELVLNDGRSLMSGEPLSEDRGSLNDYKDFDSLYQAFLAEISKWIGVSVEVHNRLEEGFKQDTPLPFLSTNIDDCIQDAKDYTDGGARYNPSYIQGIGMSTAVDSLVVLRDLVFSQGRISAKDMLAALRQDFRGYNALHALVRNYPIKYGNDISEADQVFAGLAQFFYAEVLRYRNTRGGRYYPGFMVFIRHDYLGSRTGATPDGRLAGTALSDSVGAVQGMDRHGITALFRSVTRTDYVPAVGGVTFNVRLAHSFFASEETLDKVVDAVATYFDLGGFEIQTNVLDGRTLRAAQADPAKYHNLMVRIGGFSGYFVEQTPGIQDEIIRRIEHTAQV
jgi:formate C-acetyltransferase